MTNKDITGGALAALLDKLESAKWKGEPCPNHSKGWINDSRGNRLTKLGNRNALGKIIQAHNNEIEVLTANVKAALTHEAEAVDLDALRREVGKMPTVYIAGSVHEAEIIADRERTVEFTLHKLKDIFSAIEEMRNVITLVPESYRDYSPGLYKAIDDLLSASKHLASTGRIRGQNPQPPAEGE